MKKLVLVVAMLALVAAIAVPAIAQVNQGLANRSVSGNVTTTGTATSSGDNSNQCVTPLQFGNTGAQQNTQGTIQYASGTPGIPIFNDVSQTGGTFQFTPELTAPCTQAVQQSSAASSN